MEKGKRDRYFDVRLKIKLQDVGEEEQVGNDNQIGLERRDQRLQSIFYGEVES